MSRPRNHAATPASQGEEVDASRSHIQSKVTAKTTMAIATTAARSASTTQAARLRLGSTPTRLFTRRVRGIRRWRRPPVPRGLGRGGSVAARPSGDCMVGPDDSSEATWRVPRRRRPSGAATGSAPRSPAERWACPRTARAGRRRTGWSGPPGTCLPSTGCAPSRRVVSGGIARRTRGWSRSPGLALLLLLPVPYATALSLDVLWRVHYFSGLLLVPLLGVKLAATGWRALRYYMGDRGFRADGPPHPMARLSAPILVAATVVLFVSGVAMLLGADRFGAWSTIHNGSAVVFTGALGLHLLAHLWDSPAEVLADVVVSPTPPASRVPGARGRLGLTVAAFVIGIGIATAAMPVSHWQAAPDGRAAPRWLTGDRATACHSPDATPDRQRLAPVSRAPARRGASSRTCPAPVRTGCRAALIADRWRTGRCRRRPWSPPLPPSAAA